MPSATSWCAFSKKRLRLERSDAKSLSRAMRDGAFRPAPTLVAALEGSPISVGTQNPAKLEAVRAVFASFQSADSRLDLISVDVESAVPDQPIGFEQIRNGARNRARAAFEKSHTVLAVGIEDGLTRLRDHSLDDASTASTTGYAEDDMIYNVGCAWLTDGERESHGYSAAFTYPAACSDPAIADQLPIGDLFDALWKSRRPEARGVPDADRTREPANVVASGRQGGNIGLLTGGRLDRAAYGGQAILCALVRFLHTDLYD